MISQGPLSFPVLES